jgi:hypothetical protein
LNASDEDLLSLVANAGYEEVKCDDQGQGLPERHQSGHS